MIRTIINTIYGGRYPKTFDSPLEEELSTVNEFGYWLCDANIAIPRRSVESIIVVDEDTYNYVLKENLEMTEMCKNNKETLLG